MWVILRDNKRKEKDEWVEVPEDVNEDLPVSLTRVRTYKMSEETYNDPKVGRTKVLLKVSDEQFVRSARLT